MATEAEIPESVYLKKGEKEDNVLSENLEEKVTELGNKVMQLESGSQPLETSSQVAETVNILETGKATNESETFIQALPVPMVSSNTLESCEAIRTEDQEESRTNKIEDFKERKPNVDEQVEAVSTITEPEEATENEDKYEEKAIDKKASEGIGPYNAESESGLELSESMASSKKEVLNVLEKDQGHNDDVISSQDATRDDLKETTTAEHTTAMADFKEQDPSEKPREFVKEETDDKLTDAPEACEQSENKTKENREEKPDESVKKSEEDEDNEEIRIGVQLEEKMEQNGLPHDITTDACISTQTTPEVKVTVNDEKNEEEAGKSDSPSIKEVCEETGEKVEYQEQAVNFEDVTFEGGFEEKIQQSEDNDHAVVKAKESVEEDTEEVRTVETPEKTEQQRLINVIPTDVCIPTPIEPEEKVTENEERNDEMANENDDGQTKKSEKAESEEGLKLPDSSTITLKDNETASQDEDQQKEQELYMSEKGRTQSLAEEEHKEEVIEIKDGQEETCDNLLIKEAFKETDSEKVEFESVEVSDRTILSKDETEEKEQELNMSEQGQEEDVITCSPDATSEVGETIKEYSKEMKTEKAEQQGLLHAITTDDHISSQADLQEEVIKNEEKAIEAEVKAIQSDGDHQEKSDNLFVKEVREETDLKKTEAEEGIKFSDSSNMLVSSQDAAAEEDLQEKSCYNEGKPTEIVETRESVDKIESSVKTEEETEQQKLLHVITPDSCSSTQTEVPAETFEIEEKNEEAIENDVGQMNLESMEKEQELTMSEVQGGGDDLKTSQKEDEKKEEIGQHATTVEAGDFGETTKDIIEDETKAIDVQEAKLNADGENGEREQMPEGIVNKTLGACLEIEQDQHTKEIIPSGESNAEEDVFISTQTESPEEATKNDEKATETDSDRKEKSDNPLVKEVCDETNLEKSEGEKQIDFSETSNLNLDKESIPVVTKDEDQEREQELKDETAVYEENLQEKSYDGEGNKDKIVETGESIKKDIEEQEQEQEREKKHQNESNEPELVETRGCVVDDTQEIKLSVETKEYAETKPTDNTVEDEESKDEDAIENDDDQTKKSESPLVKEVCEATSSDRAESEEAVKLSDSFSMTLDENEMSKNENLEQEQEINISEIRGEEHDVISSQNVSNEETKENTISQHATTVANFEEGQGECAKNEEIIKKEAEDESIDAGKASKQCENDANDKAEQNPEESVNKSVNSCSEVVEGNVKEDEETNKEIEAELDVDSQRNRTVDGSEMKDEVVSTEKMPSELGQSKEQYVEDIQTCLTESLGEKTEDEITKKNEHLSYDKIEDKDGNTNKDDKTFLDGRTREIEVSTLEHAPVEEKNGDLDEVSKEKFTDLKETTAVEPQEDSRPSNSLETSIEESSNLEKVKAESENLPKDDLESGSEVQVPEVLPTSEESKQNEENPNSETIMHEDEEKGTITKDISSDEKQATEIMQETFEEVCEETSSEKAELKERLKLSDSSNMEINEKAVTSGDPDQEKDQDVNISIESQGKDNVTSSHDAVSEKENLLTRSYQNEGDEHEFLETSESVDEDTKETKSSVESKENKFETPLFKEVCEATTSEKAESEDGVKHSEASNTKPDENEIARKEENLEKEQDLTMSEVQGDGDDVTSTNEVIKEAIISQPANMVGNFEEEQDLSAVTKEIIEEEAGDKSIDAQEANKECQDGAKDESEQNLEESVSKPVKPCVENVEEHFTEDEADARYSNEIEAKVDAENQVDRTENRGVIEDEVFSAEKIPLEVGQPKELNVEEIETCLAKTMTEKTEYETTKKENDSSTSEESKQNEENPNSETIMHEDEEKGTITKDISSDENQETEIMQETFEEVCEETSSEKAELKEGLKLSDSSNMEINEKAVTSGDPDQEKDQDVNISIESQGKDNVTSSHDAVSEKENLLTKSYQNEGDEHEFLETSESIDEYTKETKSSVESKENKFETPLFTEVCEATTSEKAESEDGVKHSEASNTKPDENEIARNEENLEKEQDLTMSEVQGDGDDVTSSNEVIKEATISQSANMVGNFEEEQDLSAVTKEIIEEEAGDKSIDAQEANKECQDGAKDESEQNLEESVSKPVKPCVENVEEHFTEDEADARYSNEIEAKVDKENQVDRTENRGEIEDEVFSAGKIPLEVGQPKELNVEEIETCLAKTMTEKTEYETPKKENDSSHDSILTDLNETAAVEPEDITPSGSLGTSTEDTSNSEKAKAESESLAIATHVDEEKRTATEEISSDQESEKLYISTEENVTQVEQIAENSSPNGERDTEEDVTREDQLNSTEDCSETVKDVILTKEVTSEIQKENETTDFEEQVVDKESYSQNQKEMAHEISYPDPIPVGKPEMTEVKVNAMIGQELKVAEGISCESKVKNDSVDQAPKEEQIPSLEDAATVEPEVDLQSKIKSTAYPSESEKLTIQALEPVCNVQTSEVITELEDSTIKEERIVLETVGHTDENKVQEEQIIRTDEILSAPDTEEENERSSFLQNTEEKSLSKEKLELLGEVMPTSESVIAEVQVNETKSQPEHLDITSENIMNDQTLESKLEHTKEKKLEDVKMDAEEDVTQAPEIKGVEESNKTEKNAILTDQVVVEPTKENERIEVEGQVSEEDSSTTKLETTSTSNQTELTNEIKYLKPIPVSNTEETEMKAESHLELGNIPAAEDLDCLSKASSTLEASNTERDDGTEKSMTAIREVKDESVDETSKDEVVPVVEDVTELELEANLPEIKSTDIPSDSQDSMKLTEGIPCSTQETIELKDDELISEVETHEALVKMSIQEEHPETTNDKCDTATAGVSSEKLLDEPEKLDTKDDTEEIAEGDKKALEESYQDAVAGVTGHEQFSQTEELKEPTEKVESMIPTEEPTPPTYEDQTNELTLETDKTKVEHGSLSNKDKNPESEEEEFAKPFSEDQSIEERYVEEEVQGKCCVEDTEEKSGNEVVEDVIVNEVLMEDETTKESLNIKDDNNEKAIQNQLMSVTQEVSQIERLSSSPDELLENKDLVEDAEKSKLVAETLEIKDTTFTVMKESNEAIDIPALEIENSESIVTEEKIIEADADKEKEPLEDPRADASAEAVSGSISSALEHNIDVWSEESKGHGDLNKPEEKPTEAFEITSEVAEIVPNDREVSAILTDGLLETSPEMLLAKQEPKLTTAPEKIEDEIKDKEVACKSVEKTGELQVSTLNSEIVEGKQDGPDDIQNKEKEPVQPQEQEKLVDPPSDVEIKEQESSEENALLSQNDKKIEDSPTLQSVEKEIMQGLDKGFEEASVIELQNNEKGLDHTTDIKTVDVVNNAECSEVEPPKLDTKLETSEFVNEENQRDQKNEVDEHKEAATPVEDVKSSTPELEVPSVMDETADKEGSNEDPEDKKAEAYEAEKGILTDNKYPGLTFGISKPTEEVPGMKQEPSELNAPTTLGTEATEDLKISQKYVTNLSHEQAEPTEKSFTVDAEDLNASKASGTEEQCGNEVTQDERKTSDEKKKSESAESTKGKTEVSENLNTEIDPALTKDQQVDKEETVDSAVKTDEENEEDNEKLGSCSDAPVMVEASKDMDVKVHKKSHNMLSGVGSKVKHSIAKVKKAITGKSFQPKPTSS